MELDGIADFSFNLGNGCSCGNAARKVWHVGREVAFGTLNYDGVSHIASLLQVAGALSVAHCAVLCFVFDPSGSDMAKVPAAVRRVTASPNPPDISFPDAIGCL